jgi:hypothetical protein
MSLPFPPPGMAVERCREIGNAYHRTDRERRVSCICEILLELGRILLDPRYDNRVPAERTSQARQLFMLCQGAFSRQL